MDDGAQDLDVAGEAARDASADDVKQERRRGIVGWLLERRPERTSQPEPEVATVEPEPEVATPEPTPELTSEPTPEPEVATVEPEPEPEPEAPAEPEVATVEPEPELEPEPEPEVATAAEPEAAAVPLTKARPRPSSSAPKIYEPAAATATEPKPGETFFNRPIDADDEAWHRDADKDEARAERDKKRKDRRSKVVSGLRSLRKVVIVAVVAVVVALLLRNYVVAPYYVPSASMEPTLHGCPNCNDDHVLVEKLSYRFHDVQAGDIIVFNRPDSARWKTVPDKVLIKRVIGVAGDKLTIKGGHVYRNGQLLSEPYVNQKCHPATTASPGSTSTAAKTFPTVPNGDVFVMGDNRCDSEDSRLLGNVPTNKVIGRAFMIIWPRVHSL